MADDDDHEIGRQIVGAVRREVEVAHRTIVVDLEEGAKQFALATTRTAAAKAALDRGPHVALLAAGGLPGPSLLGHGLASQGSRCCAHGAHDLPFPDLLLPDLPLPDLPGLDLPLPAVPGLPLPDLRSFSRELRPGYFLAGACICALGPSPRPRSRCRPRGAIWPSDSNSKRNAPATGAASTRRTSTTSPSRCMAPLRVPTSAWRVSS